MAEPLKENASTKSGGVEIVADQKDDGAYEIRVERQDAAVEDRDGDRAASAVGSREREVGATVLRADRTQMTSASPLRSFGLGAGVVAVVALGLFGVKRIAAVGEAQAPVMVEVEEPEFRGYVVEPPQLVVDELRVREQALPTDGPDAGSSLDAQTTAPDPTANRNAAPSFVPPQMDEQVRNALRAVAEDEEGLDDEPGVAGGARDDRRQEPSLADEASTLDELYDEELDEFGEPYDDEYEDDEYGDEPYDDEYEDDEYVDDDEYIDDPVLD